jgi:luciferase family oxidoreductase group 1
MLDLAAVGKGETARDALTASVALAQRAEAQGYHRVWYAEHHNIKAIASSATSVVIAHVAANTSTIRLGAGGIMLPNHPPLVIAEQFGTLATLHPGRIDLGLGRAPGSDQPTMRAMRFDPTRADDFPRDVLELQGYLADETRVPGIYATPGRGTNVPLYILGSSTFGAQLAALLGLPYAFASHFAPASLHDAIAIYRDRFEPSEQCAEPYLIVGANVVVAENEEQAQQNFERVRRARVGIVAGRDRTFTDEEADEILASPQGRYVDQMLHYTAVGTPDVVQQYLAKFAGDTGADEVMVVHASPTVEARLRSVELIPGAVEW